ncbi:MAG: FMN-binding protein [Lachnospiraceae bacterium]|nr:FMN-binding protein [Lachnospiraceae bacterium]
MNTKSIIKDALILFAITLVAGLLLGTVYTVTLDARNEQAKKRELAAYEEVLTGGEHFTEIEFSQDDAVKVLEAKNITSDQAVIDKVTLIQDKNGSEVGYAITVTDKEGYGGNITMIVGVKADGTCGGVSITSISETAGLGMKANTEEFKAQFKDVRTEAFVVEKNSQSGNGDNVIDALSGATVTTNAVTNGVNAAIAMYESLTEVE